MNIDKYFTLGKLKHTVLEKMLKNFVSDLDIKDKRVVMGQK
ncbi:MAG: hypothetical protein ACTSQS_14280 [Promethearchaeota archaeon]